MYSTWKVVDLKSELKKRGGSLRGKKADLIQRLEFYDQNFTQLSTLASQDENEDPMMSLPTQETYKDINSDTKLPPITKTHIRQYLNYKEKKMSVATTLYESRHLVTARASIQGDSVFVHGICRKTMKKLDYQVDIKLESNGNPEQSHCECAAGSGLTAVCKHVAVLLLALEDIVKRKILLKQEVCTQQLQQFHVPKRPYTGSPVRADRLARKRKYLNTKRPYPLNTIDKINYNNRVRNLILNYRNSNMPMKQLYEPANPVALYQDHNYTDIDPEIETLKSLQLMNVSASEIDQIQTSTRDQSSSSLWHKLRKNRITASRFHTVCHLRQSSLNKFAETCLLVDCEPFTSRATSHGVINEKIALRKYCSLYELTVVPCGLFIHKDKPFLAASPDGLLGDETIIEIKCPYSARYEEISSINIPYLETKDGKLELKKTSPYYYQIQGQLFCTGRLWCNLIIYTYNDMKVIFLSRDELFIKNMVSKLEEYFHTSFKPVLLRKLAVARNFVCVSYRR